jgi:hypothetical protein
VKKAWDAERKKHTRVGAFLRGTNMSERLTQPTRVRIRHVDRLEKGKEGGR